MRKTLITELICRFTKLVSKYARRYLGRQKIVVFSDSNYLEVLENWLDFFPKSLLNRLEVVALDTELYSHLVSSRCAGNEFSCVLLEWDGNLEHLWISRVEYIRSQIEQGYSVLHSDIDAIWMDDPLDYVIKNSADLVFSQGTVWPRDVYDKIGIVLCCGFFYIKSNSVTEHLMREWSERIKIDTDDQRSLNRMLLEYGIRWPEQADYHLDFEGNKIGCFNDIMYTNAKTVKVGLLPHRLFQRIYEAQHDAIIFHPLSEKDGRHISHTLMNYNIWNRGIVN